MITNIIDKRKRKYRWKKITAIVEPTNHNNSCKDTDKSKIKDLWFGYDEKAKISLTEAIQWASKKPGENTLYLYDLGQGINIVEIRNLK